MDSGPQSPNQPTTPRAPDGPPAPAPPGPGSAGPAGAAPGSGWSTPSGPSWSAPAAPPPPGPESGAVPPAAPPRNRGRLGLVLAALAGGAGIVAVKILSGLVVGSVVGSALGSFFGGPYQRLPPDVRTQFEQRIKAGLGNQLDGLSETAAVDRVRSLVQRGIVRLDDPLLVRYMTVQVQALDHSETATCAAFARASVGGKVPSAEISRGLLGKLDDRSLQEFMEINVRALEAEARAAPAARTISEDQADAMFERLAPRLSSQDVDTIQALGAGTTVTDEAACSAVRNLYDTALTMDPADVALFARYDVQP